MLCHLSNLQQPLSEFLYMKTLGLIHRSVIVMALAIHCAFLFLHVTFLGQVSASASAPIRDPAVATRANALLGQMTPDEKIGQLSQIFFFAPSASIEKRLKAGELGSVLFVTDPSKINSIQRTAVEGSRLHIPLL